MITDAQRAKCNAGVSAEQFELVTPAFAVEAAAHDSSALRGTVLARRIAEHFVHRLKCDGHAGQTEIQRAVFPCLDVDTNATTRREREFRVPLVVVVTLRLEERHHDPRAAAVEHRVQFFRRSSIGPRETVFGDPRTRDQPLQRPFSDRVRINGGRTHDSRLPQRPELARSIHL